MPTLIFRFPGRRYHATPWGHHVNEGLIEWPPSPWRLLRALLSVGYTRLGWAAGMAQPWQSRPPELAQSLLLKLAGTLPHYVLPPAVGAHSRHYMPVAYFKGDREHTTLVFDTWAQVDEGELAVQWPVALTAEETRLLGELAAHIGYLGRAESWVMARLGSEAEPVPINCLPCDGHPAPGPGWEQVSLLATGPSYETWREQRLQHALADLPPIPLPEKKKLSAKDRKPAEQRETERQRAQAPYPADLIACLQTDTNWQREYGWSQPPGSRRVLYWRRADALRARPVLASAQVRCGTRVPFVLLSLSTPSDNLHALPPVARSLPQGEMLHRQMVGASAKLNNGVPASVLSGCDAKQRPLRGTHGHAHVLSLDLDRDGHIDHLLVWARDGLDRGDQQAIRRTRGTWTKGGVDDLRLAWAAAGSDADMRQLPEPQGHVLQATVGRGRVWASATPFVPPRHLKPRGANSVQGQVRAELRSRGLPESVTVEVLDPREHQLARAQRHHVRVRQHGPRPPVDIGLTLRLTFDQDVQGPICLGYASHFGLGRFEQDGGARAASAVSSTGEHSAATSLTPSSP